MLKIYQLILAVSLLLTSTQISIAQITLEGGGWQGSDGVTTRFSSSLLRIGVDEKRPIILPDGIVLNSVAHPTLGMDLLTHPILRADVRWVAADWDFDATPLDPTDNWSRWEVVEIRTSTDTQSFPISNDSANPSQPGSWNLNEFGDHARTIDWDLSGLELDTSGPIELWLQFRISDTAFPHGGVLWVDDIRLHAVPEPTTLIMTILGFARVISYKRRPRS